MRWQISRACEKPAGTDAGIKIFVDGSTITSHIKRIRRKFVQLDGAFDCIETVYGMGYRWNTEKARRSSVPERTSAAPATGS